MNLELLSMELFLCAWGLLLIILNLAGLKNNRVLGYITAAGVIIASAIGIFFLYGRNEPLARTGKELFKGFLYFTDPLSVYFKMLILLLVLMAVLLSMDYFHRHRGAHAEFYPILLFCSSGLLMMTSAGDFLLLFVAMELVSIPLYVLAAFERKERRSAEAGFKYFMLGAFSSALFLFGVSILYGMTNSLIFVNKSFATLPTITGTMNNESFFTAGPAIKAALSLAIVMIVAGLGFKIAASPFHMWAPDVYEGSPIPVTAFISVAPKVAGIAVLLRVFPGGIDACSSNWMPLFALIGMLSIVIGNLTALRQDNIKRLLAYSGISQVGFILLGFAGISANRDAAISYVLFYTTVYALTNMGVFAVAQLASEHYGTEKFSEYKGLAVISPSLSLMAALALLSLAGIPPLSGFMAKFLIFASIFNAFDHRLMLFVVLAIIFSVISLFYYLRILKYMYYREIENRAPLVIPGVCMVVLSISTLATVFLGLLPSFFTLTGYVAEYLNK
ncbi:MAG: NADH-quinone oxidoreductase subunit N [Candidatus Eremiobacteraeota bacterium]|nr:NADH-quinone oxidoreductase subunit N [Candidatus Eremiobacteraeota bacterium]